MWAVREHSNDDPYPSERPAHRHVRSSERRLDVAPVPAVELQADLQRADRDDPLAGSRSADVEPGAQRHRAAGRRDRRRRRRRVGQRTRRRRGAQAPGRPPARPPRAQRADGNGPALRAPVHRGLPRPAPHQRQGAHRSDAGQRRRAAARARPVGQDADRRRALPAHARRDDQRPPRRAFAQCHRGLADAGAPARDPRNGVDGAGRRRADARRRQDRAARSRAARARGLQRRRGRAVPRPRRPGPDPGPPHGPVGRRAAGHRAAPRACGRQRLPERAHARAHVAARADRGAREPLRQPVQRGDAGAVDHAARGVVAPVRAMPFEVRRDLAERLHQDDGHLPAGLARPAERRPLRDGDDRQRRPSAEAARAGPRSGRGARGRDPPGPREDTATGHPPQPEGRAVAHARIRLPEAAPADRVLLQRGKHVARGCDGKRRRHDLRPCRS